MMSLNEIQDQSRIVRGLYSRTIIQGVKLQSPNRVVNQETIGCRSDTKKLIYTNYFGSLIALV
jgi:hypothetical protein